MPFVAEHVEDRFPWDSGSEGGRILDHPRLAGLALVTLGLLSAQPDAQRRITPPYDDLFVDEEAPPGGDGRSWARPLRHLQDALTEAESRGVPTRIHVAQGTYFPDRSSEAPLGTGDRRATFHLRNGVSLLGGYAGPGANDPNECAPERFPSTLSGDIGIAGDPLDNVHSVVTGDLTDRTALIEGFRITGGRADGSVTPRSLRRGAGIWCKLGEPVIRRCHVVDNQAYFGAGIYLDDSGDVLIEDCVFERNETLTSNGAGLFSLRTRLELRSCRFVENVSAVAGGAFQIVGGTALIEDCSVEGNTAIGGTANFAPSGVTTLDAIVRRCTFIGNRALTNPLTNAIGGAVIVNTVRSMVFEECVFQDNRADEEGGAVYVQDTDGLLFRDCRFAGNRGGTAGGALFVLDSVVEARRSRFSRNVSDGLDADAGGGAIFAEGASVLLEACEIAGNEAAGFGGGVRAWRDGQISLVNSVVAGNQALQGGGALAAESGAAGTITTSLLCCTVYGNSSATRGFEGVLQLGGDLTVRNCVLRENSPGDIVTGNTTLSLTHSILGGLYPGIGNLFADPLLADPLGPDGIPGTGDEDYRPTPTSPAIDAGNTTALSPGVVTDFAGDPRIVDGDGSGTSEVDIGALEFQPSASKRSGSPPVYALSLAWTEDHTGVELLVRQPGFGATHVLLLASHTSIKDQRGVLLEPCTLGTVRIGPAPTRVPLPEVPPEWSLQGVFLGRTWEPSNVLPLGRIHEERR